MTAWHAETPEALEETVAAVHDAWFDIDDVLHDQAAHTLVVPFAQAGDWGPMLDDPGWRDAPKPELVKTTWRYRDERVPFMRGTLRIAAVDAVRLDASAGDAAMLLGVRYDETAQTVTVEGVSGDLVAQVRRLDVAVDLVPEVALWVRRRHGLIGSSETPLWRSRALTAHARDKARLSRPRTEDV